MVSEIPPSIDACTELQPVPPPLVGTWQEGEYEIEIDFDNLHNLTAKIRRNGKTVECPSS